MNVKLLRKVKKHILAEPKRLRMGVVFARGEWVEGLENAPSCGTVGCIAGWACAIGGVKPNSHGDYRTGQACTLLELTPGEGQRLFYGSPQAFVAAWDDDGSEKAAKVCAARIEHFIKTKGRE